MPQIEAYSAYDLECAKIAIRYINVNYKYIISPSSLAGKVFINEKKLQSLVQLLTGFTIHEYQMHQRIEQIKPELADKSRPIKSVAQIYGFRSATHFNRAFKKKTGLTPRQYRSLIIKCPDPTVK